MVSQTNSSSHPSRRAGGGGLRARRSRAGPDGRASPDVGSSPKNLAWGTGFARLGARETVGLAWMQKARRTAVNLLRRDLRPRRLSAYPPDRPWAGAPNGGHGDRSTSARGERLSRFAARAGSGQGFERRGPGTENCRPAEGGSRAVVGGTRSSASAGRRSSAGRRARRHNFDGVQISEKRRTGDRPPIAASTRGPADSRLARTASDRASRRDPRRRDGTAVADVEAGTGSRPRPASPVSQTAMCWLSSPGGATIPRGSTSAGHPRRISPARFVTSVGARAEGAGGSKLG